MTVAVVGGTGTLGRQVVAGLRSRGADVRVLSRKSPDYPVDLRSGGGLAEALSGCDTVVDASNGATSTLVDGSGRLLAAEQSAGVGHHVAISIVGCDRAPMSYYKIKVRQEQVVEAGPVPWTIVRATQFHNLIDTMFTSSARVGVLPKVRALVQSVDVSEAAAFIADTATGGPLRARVQIAGPQLNDARELAQLWRLATHSRAVSVPIHVPGKLGRALREGALTNEHPDARGTIRFADWLESRAS
ncbi:SDR family oxidoreductase [Rathayibacter soli]|uniref:SDR family oxidoreductase n=1 Tax=Rathayibacter soli TaxID=3144168 RepID=UPI0027E4F0E3|nr:NAD(P)H-binding protein [Glaciibacter superstes]